MGKRAVVVEAYVNLELTMGNGHDLRAAAAAQGIRLSRAMLNELI